MGEEITENSFGPLAYENYYARLADETSVLHQWLLDGRLNTPAAWGGFEQEAWLLTPDFSPAPVNDKFIEAANSEMVSAELARFNIELNVEPQKLEGSYLRRFHRDLQDNWDRCARIADSIGVRQLMIGILPNLQDSDLVLENMSSLNRYRALNEQIMLARQGIPMHLDIAGHEHLKSTHHDVMLESAATSFQIHRQVPADLAPRYINAAIAISALSVAVGTNSPYLFGRRLWEETRIPLFEQAVEVGGLGNAVQGPVRRVTFGSSYIRQDVFECFRENLEHYPVLLPVELDAPVQSLPHLRLHNGTIWRWNRPLLGFDNGGTPHIRLEHRVISAGPSIVDEIANAAFFYGLLEWTAGLEKPVELEIEHAVAKSNFYEAARLGMDAHITWFDNSHVQISRLILDDLLPKVRLGLERLDTDPADIDDYIGIIEARIRKHQAGSHWQRAFVEKNGGDMRALTKASYEYQQTGNPVHDWPI